MNKTLKEIADELGVDKQKVYRFVKKNHINEVLQSASVKQYDEVAQRLIKQHFSEKVCVNEAHQNHINDAVFDALLKQLEEKDKQIDELHRLLGQEQQLNAINQKKIELLEQKEEATVEEKRTWWDKVRGR